MTVRVGVRLGPVRASMGSGGARVGARLGPVSVSTGSRRRSTSSATSGGELVLGLIAFGVLALFALAVEFWFITLPIAVILGIGAIVVAIEGRSAHRPAIQAAASDPIAAVDPVVRPVHAPRSRPEPIVSLGRDRRDAQTARRRDAVARRQQRLLEQAVARAGRVRDRETRMIERLGEERLVRRRRINRVVLSTLWPLALGLWALALPAVFLPFDVVLIALLLLARWGRRRDALLLAVERAAEGS